MNRPSTAMAEMIKDAQLTAAVSLEPSGRHVLEVEGEGLHMPMLLTLDQARWLRRAIEQFETECAWDDGHPVDRINRKRVPIMTGERVGSVR